MAETIKSFIDKLQADGVQAGRAAAEKIRAETEGQAKERIRQAEEQAKQIVADAQAEIENLRSRAQTELELAARDVAIRLQETLARGLKSALIQPTKEKLTDPDFLGALLRDIVLQYVRADIEGPPSVTINVSEEMRHRLVDWVIRTMHEDSEVAGSRIDLHGSLAEAGFEYRVGDGTVEVTVDSVVESLSGLIGPEVRKTLARAMGTGGEGKPHTQE